MRSLLQLLLAPFHFQKGTSAAYEGKAGGVLAAVCCKDLDEADFSGLPDMRRAAGADVNAGNGDNPDGTVDLLFAAVVKLLQNLCRRVFAGNGYIVPYHSIGLLLQRQKILRRKDAAGIQRYRIVAQTKADILIAPLPVKKTGENVLSGMILHIGIAMIPVDGTVHLLPGDKNRGKCCAGVFGRKLQGVRDDAVSGNLHVDHRKAREHAAVRRLSALLREKQGRRQNNLCGSGEALPRRQDLGIKFCGIRLCVVQPDGFIHKILLQDEENSGRFRNFHEK